MPTIDNREIEAKLPRRVGGAVCAAGGVASESSSRSVQDLVSVTAEIPMAASLLSMTEGTTSLVGRRKTLDARVLRWVVEYGERVESSKS